MIRAWPEPKGTGWATIHSNKPFSGLLSGQGTLRRLSSQTNLPCESLLWACLRLTTQKTSESHAGPLSRSDVASKRGLRNIPERLAKNNGRQQIHTGGNQERRNRGERSTIQDGFCSWTQKHYKQAACCVHQNPLTTQALPAPDLPWHPQATTVATVAGFQTPQLLPDCGAQIQLLRCSAWPPRIGNESPVLVCH